MQRFSKKQVGGNTRKEVEMEEKQELEAVIDWVEVTFRDIGHAGIINEIFQFPRDFMSFESRGRFRYAGKWNFGGIELLVPPTDYPEMGYHIYLTGSACREMEIYLRTQKRTWFDFFKTCMKYNGNFTRLDIAVDDRKPYFKIKKLGEKVGKQECVSKFKNWNFIDGGTISGSKDGCTLNLGSRQSKCSMVFYEKNYEQSKKTGQPVEFYGAWNRYEIRLRQETANACVEKLVERGNICFVGMEIINYYVSMVVPSDTNKQKSRWPLWKPWEKFMDGMGKIKLSMHPAPRTLEQKKQWVADYVAPTLKMIQIADDNLGEEFLKETIQDARLKEKQRKIVEDYLQNRAEMQEKWEQEKKPYEDAVWLQKHGFTEYGGILNPFEIKEIEPVTKKRY